MTRWIWTCTMIFVLGGLAGGCQNKANDQDAIRASIDKHLAERTDLNMSAMDREIKQITVNGDKASAQVEFRLKQGGGSMQVSYALERRDGVWTVQANNPGGGQSPHVGADGSSGAPGNAPQSNLPSFDDLLKNNSGPATGR
jgi:hypothetical protein